MRSGPNPLIPPPPLAPIIDDDCAGDPGPAEGSIIEAMKQIVEGDEFSPNQW
jgi:hypothetical protein